MNEFLNKYNDFLSVFNKGKTMVLSSCEDTVTLLLITKKKPRNL